ncbi:MAG: hypothetical protein M1819_006956 [Sarea resinae]|nr:MAG: hypothetical protein M1819_006956 [Sarea resinae]
MKTDGDGLQFSVMAEPAPHDLSPEGREVVELSYHEGHDADVPSNAGAFDAEKHSLRRTSTTRSARPREAKVPSPDIEKAEEDKASSNDDGTDEFDSDDPNLVFWDGPDDLANPMNWSSWLKMSNIGVVSIITFITPLASSMFAPGVPEVMARFHQTNVELASFVVSVYLLGYVFGPIVVAPISELYGRLVVYHSCNILFVVFNVACAVSSNFNMLIGFRFLAGCAGSAPITIGAGSIADLMPQEKRGGAMALFAMGPLLGPVVGPIAGGFLANAEGWRWVFWVLAIASGVLTILGFFILRETYAPVLLGRKAKKLQKETGNPNLRSKMDNGMTTGELFKITIIRPMKLLIFSPIVFSLSLFMAVVYGYLYLLFTTFTMVFEEQYHWSGGIVGLSYIGIGLGMFIALFVFGFASDKIMKAKGANGGMKPEYRLPPLIPAALILPIGFFWYGWAADKHTHWIVPIIGTAFIGLGTLGIFLPIQTYLVDAFTLHAASAMAANTILRSLFGALLPLAGQKMYNTLGLGWGNSLLGFIALALIPIPIIFCKYGEVIRTRYPVKL